MRCPACNHDNRAERRFCAECGAKLGAACPSCGAENEPGEKFCGSCGAPLAASPAAEPVGTGPAPEEDASRPAGERRQLTILFCDLVGSTELSERLDPEDWQEVLRSYQSRAGEVVARHGGHVAQYLGDGLLVYFGWPQSHDDAAERAVRAGLRLVDTAASVAVDGAPLSVRVGIHTGAVVVGALGGAERQETLALGDTPNLAARVQAAAEPATVLITAATQRLVAGMFVIEDRGAQRLKGVREPLTLYRVVQPSGVRSRLAVAAGRLTPFVGREAELATLLDRWERVSDGEGQNVLIFGEAGVGKSRLAYQLRERLAAAAHTWLECRATPYTERTPFFPVIELVQQGLAFDAEDTAAEKLAKLEQGLAGARRPLAEAVPLLADFLGLPHPESFPRLQMSPEQQRRRIMEVLVTWNLALSEAQPLVLLMEDLHWCDPSSLELLGRLIEQSPTARVLVLGTARPEFTPPWPARSNLTRLQPGRLTKRQAREMMAALGGTELPAATLDALVARADGVPLYVEELTKTVAEPGAARGVEAIPATLADSLMARLDRLSSAKEVAQVASVLGREFSYTLLHAIVGTRLAAPLPEPHLRDALARLVEAEIVFVRGEPPEATYTFKHALIQEAAYASLLRSTRQQLHGRVVDLLVERFPERVEAEPEVVARHAEAAGRPNDAILYHGRAGELAQARSAHEEALRHLRHAIELLATQPDSVERAAAEVALQMNLTPSVAATRGYAHPETEAAWERIRLLAGASGDQRSHSSALLGLANVYVNSAKFESALTLIEQVLEIAESAGDDVQIIAACREKLIAEFYQGRFKSLPELCERVIGLHEPSRHHRAVISLVGDDAGAVARAYDAWAFWQLGYPDRALVHAREAIEFAEAVDHPFTVASTRFFNLVVHWFRRDAVAQREEAEELLRFTEAQGFPLFVGAAMVLRGNALGDTAAVLQGMEIAAGTGNQNGVPAVIALLAEAYQAQDRHAEALDAVETAFAAAEQTKQPFFDAELHRLRGEILLSVEPPVPRDQAEACFGKALDIARRQSAKSFELRAATSLALLWRDQGKRSQAHDLLAPVYAWFTEGFDTRDLIEAKALLLELDARLVKRPVRTATRTRPTR